MGIRPNGMINLNPMISTHWYESGYKKSSNTNSSVYMFEISLKLPLYLVTCSVLPMVSVWSAHRLIDCHIYLFKISCDLQSATTWTNWPDMGSYSTHKGNAFIPITVKWYIEYNLPDLLLSCLITTHGIVITWPFRFHNLLA